MSPKPGDRVMNGTNEHDCGTVLDVGVDANGPVQVEWDCLLIEWCGWDCLNPLKTVYIRFHPATQLSAGQWRPCVRISADARMMGAKYANVVYGDQATALAHAVSAARQVVLEGIEGADCVTLVGRED